MVIYHSGAHVICEQAGVCCRRCRQVVVAGFYTAWLLPASFVGVAVFLYGVFSMGHNTPAYVITTCACARQLLF